MSLLIIFFFKQKTAYEMRISDWSSDVCSSDLFRSLLAGDAFAAQQVALGASIADELRPDDRAAIARRQADMHMRIRDARRFISDDDIAEECDRGAQPDRVAVDPGDDRLLAGKDAPEYFLALLDALLELPEIERIEHILNVAARDERATSAGDKAHLGRRTKR